MARQRVYDHALAGMEGALCDVSPRRLLDACRARQVTGVLRITSWGRAGGVQMRAGQVEQVFFGPLRDDAALAELLTLRDGMFELRQEMPDLRLAPSPQPGRIALSALMRQCRERALSCTITVIRDRDHAELAYRAGALLHANINGIPYDGDDDQAMYELERFEHGSVRVAPLPAALAGRRPTRRADTAPATPAPARARPRARSRAATPPPLPPRAARRRPPTGTPPDGVPVKRPRARTARGTPTGGLPPIPPASSMPSGVPSPVPSAMAPAPAWPGAGTPEAPVPGAPALAPAGDVSLHSRGRMRPALLLPVVLGLVLVVASLIAAHF